MKRTITLALSVFAVALVGCSDDDGDTQNNNNNNAPTTLSAATYNGGLARGFVAYADDRAPLVADAVAGIGADIICVQEIWAPEHVDAVVTAAGSDYEAVFLEPFPDPNPGPPSCDASTLQPLADCAETNCASVPTDDLVDCMLAQCGVHVLAQSADCQSCLAAHVGSEFETIVGSCTTGSAAYAYGGSYGIGLLSTQPITQHDHLVFESHYNRRAVIWAEVETETHGTVHVFCTHLTAVFSTVPWPETTGSWSEEQAVQVTELRAYVDQQAGASGQVILMGDFNSGPAGSTWVADEEANYNALAVGYTNPYVDAADAACTFCDLNPLIGGIDHDSSIVIDHILLRGIPGTFTTSRLLDAPVTITVDGTPVDTALSDHYGVQVVLDTAVAE